MRYCNAPYQDVPDWLRITTGCAAPRITNRGCGKTKNGKKCWFFSGENIMRFASIDGASFYFKCNPGVISRRARLGQEFEGWYILLEKY